MTGKLFTFALLLLTGCHWAAEGYVEPGPRGAGGSNHGSHLFDQHHTGGSGPVLADTYAECWRLPGGGYGWYFDATAHHSWGPDYTEDIESVWVDVYFGAKSVTFELYDSNALYYPLDAPGAEIYGYQTEYGDGVWMRSEYENMTALRCDSYQQYEVYTTAYDYDGNYQTVVEYL
tara:strand:- start:232 stop:756 length:525 start_codon:yes stop_codon:yes gene_type:complete